MSARAAASVFEVPAADTVRPTPVKFGPALWFASVAIGCQLVGVIMFKAPRAERLPVAMAAVLFIGVVVLLAFKSARAAALSWDASALSMSRLGRPRVLQRRGDPPGRVVRTHVTNARSGANLWRLWLDPSGQCLAKIVETQWDTNELDRLDTLAGLRVEIDPEPHTMRQLAARYPGSVPRVLTRPWMVAAATLAVIVMLASITS